MISTLLPSLFEPDPPLGLDFFAVDPRSRPYPMLGALFLLLPASPQMILSGLHFARYPAPPGPLHCLRALRSRPMSSAHSLDSHKKYHRHTVPRERALCYCGCLQRQASRRMTAPFLLADIQALNHNTAATTTGN